MSTTHVPVALRRQVRDRAGERCEYCLIPESMSWTTHTIDHILAEKHGGTTEADNLALACALCNSRKGSDLASIDEQTGLLEPLFHPRRDAWSEHFQLVAGRIEPRKVASALAVRAAATDLTDSLARKLRTRPIVARVLGQDSKKNRPPLMLAFEPNVRAVSVVRAERVPAEINDLFE